MKIVCTITLALLLASSLGAQKIKWPQYKLHAGMGVFPTFLKDNTRTLTLPATVEWRARLDPRYSIGLLAGHSASESIRDYGPALGIRQYRNHFTVLNLRLAAHTSPLSKWEAYGGMILGYGFSDVNVLRDDPKDRGAPTAEGPKVRNGFYFSGFVGTQCRLGQRFGLYAELGYGISILSAGMYYRFRAYPGPRKGRGCR